MPSSLRPFIRNVALIGAMALLGGVGIFSAPSRAQGPSTPSPAASPSSPSALIREVHPGIFQIGPVTLDKAQRQVRFPAVVNQREGLIEYLLVGNEGKTHESLFRTAVRPFHLHTAMLLLGAKPRGKSSETALPPSALDNAYLAHAPLPDGVSVTISVSWKLPGREAETRSAESLITNTKAAAPMTEGSWIYNGSLFEDGRFVADEELSFAAVVTDSAALMNNPRLGHEDDSTWTVATDRVPPMDTPVEIRITCLEPKP